MVILYAPRAAMLGLLSHVGMTRRQSAIGDAFWRVYKLEGHIEGEYSYVTQRGLDEFYKLAGSLHSGGCYERSARHSKLASLRQFKYLDYPMQAVGEFGGLAPEQMDPHMVALLRSIRDRSRDKETA